MKRETIKKRLDAYFKPVKGHAYAGFADANRQKQMTLSGPTDIAMRNAGFNGREKFFLYLAERKQGRLENGITYVMDAEPVMACRTTKELIEHIETEIAIQVVGRLA